MKFFFDTADGDYITKLWDKLEGRVGPDSVLGITTNPGGFSKVNCDSVEKWGARTLELCQLVTDIRGDNKGVVYVQQPNSSMSPEEVLAWVKLIQPWGDGKTSVALKIPPFKKILTIADQLSKYAEVNVTGVADCSTALRAFSYGVKYVSIITGRMEEQDINARAQVAFTSQRKVDGGQIIAGSMRTVEGLRWVCAYGTVPTIGSRVWDILFNEVTVEEFKKFWIQDKSVFDDPLFSPLIDGRMTDLSSTFFKQMDKLGQPIYNQFMNK